MALGYCVLGQRTSHKMVGLGTMMQDPYGWVLDESGDPELYYFVGTIINGENGIIHSDRANKLYKIVFNKNGDGTHNGTIGLSLVKDLINDYTYPNNDYPPETYGNLTFISRDVFVLSSGTSPDLNTFATYRKEIMYANKLNSTGTDVTAKIWNRKIIKQGQTDPDVSGTTNHWPGMVSGFSYVSPESNEYDTNRNSAGIICLTGCYPYGGPWGPHGDTGQAHKNYLLRLDTDDENINNNYYEDTDSWNEGADVGGGESSTVSAWKQISLLGNGSTDPDQNEGWCALDSQGNLYYGRALMYWATSAGGNDVVDHGNQGLPNPSTYYVHSTYRVDAPLSGGIGNRTVMHYNNQLPLSNFMDQAGYTLKQGNFMGADSGCCDIYGQTVHGKDSLWLMVNRNDQRIGPNQTVTAAYNADKEGLWVVKRNGTSDRFDIQQHYTLDSTWNSAVGNHDTTPSSTQDSIIVNSGMSFRPNSKR